MVKPQALHYVEQQTHGKERASPIRGQQERLQHIDRSQGARLTVTLQSSFKKTWPWFLSVTRPLLL